MTRISDVLTVPEASVIKGISANGIRIAIRDGRLKAERKGDRMYLIHRKDLDAWIPTRHCPKGKRRAARARKQESIGAKEEPGSE